MSGQEERKATPELTSKEKAARSRLRKKMMNDLESWGVPWPKKEADVDYWDTVEAMWESVRGEFQSQGGASKVVKRESKPTTTYKPHSQETEPPPRTPPKPKKDDKEVSILDTLMRLPTSSPDDLWRRDFIRAFQKMIPFKSGAQFEGEMKISADFSNHPFHKHVNMLKAAGAVIVRASARVVDVGFPDIDTVACAMLGLDPKALPNVVDTRATISYKAYHAGLACMLQRAHFKKKGWGGSLSLSLSLSPHVLCVLVCRLLKLKARLFCGSPFVCIASW